MGKLRVTIEHGNDNSMLYFMGVIALILIMAAVAIPAITFATAAATAFMAIVKIVLMSALALVCVGGVIWCGFGIRSHIRDEQIANEWRAREEERKANQRLKAYSSTSPKYNQINAFRDEYGIPRLGEGQESFILRTEAQRLDR